MRLLHHSAAPLLSVRSTTVTETFHKPCGLWVSVDGPDSWEQWCRGEDFGIGRLANKSLIVLSVDANILYVKTAEEIDQLTAEYKIAGYGRYHMDWPRLARRYDGIIIAPYQWQRRMSDHTSWYYSWDCASGCIWNASAIMAVAPFAEDHGKE